MGDHYQSPLELGDQVLKKSNIKKVQIIGRLV